MDILKIFLLLLPCIAESIAPCFDDANPLSYVQSVESLFRASDRFSIHLLRALNATGDAFFSPFSVWSSLLLVYLGSRSTTEKELEGILGLQKADKKAVAHSYRALKTWFSMRTRQSSATTLNVANNLFMQKDTPVHGCLVQFLNDDLAYVDFERAPELARLAINFLVRRQTEDRIKDILPPRSVSSFTQFLITSTMHFKGAWLQPFPPHATAKRPFFVSNQDYLLVDTMIMRDTFMYATSDELQCSAVEMPFVGRSLTMVIMLPKNKVHGVQILISSLTMRRLNDLTEDMFPRSVVVVMPKFRIESTFQLSPVLMKMGLRSLLTGSLDLSGFTKDRRLEMDAVYHKAYVSVNEQGTEAAAGTSVAALRRSVPTRTIDFVVDHPFVFLIRENDLGSILFIGIVRHPNHLSIPTGLNE